MIDYNQRSYQKELLDGNNIPFADIAGNMKELDIINTYLGGHAITIKGCQKLLGTNKTISICEIGCGGGDNLNALSNFCIKNRIDATFTGIDINPECIDFAKKKINDAKSTIYCFGLSTGAISKRKAAHNFFIFILPPLQQYRINKDGAVDEK